MHSNSRSDHNAISTTILKTPIAQSNPTQPNPFQVLISKAVTQ